tara:strand:+ start:5880 stop:6227 length:348 start_codon:yes stop_codon:yes gene_type:complete
MSEAAKDAAGWLESGWAGVDAPTEVSSEEQERAAEEDHKINRAIHRMFTTGTGPIVLEWLRTRTIEQPAFNPSIANPAEQGFTREGQNSIYREFVRRMRAAEDGPPTAKGKGKDK